MIISSGVMPATDGAPTSGERPSDSARYTSLWASDGRRIFWEYRGRTEAAGADVHTVAWFDGEAWRRFHPMSGFGSLLPDGPAGSAAFPSRWLGAVAGMELVDLVDKGWALSSDQEGNGRRRLEFHSVGTSSARRVVVLLAEEGGRMQLRRTELHRGTELRTAVDYLEHSSVEGGVQMPMRAVLFNAGEHSDGRGTSHSIDVQLMGHSTGVLDELCAQGFPRGTLVDNHFASGFHIASQTPERAYVDWLERRSSVSRAGAPGRGFWEQATAGDIQFERGLVPVEASLAGAENDCGPVALAALFHEAGVPAPQLSVIREACSPEGATLAELVDVSSRYGLRLVAGRWSLRDVARLRVPFLAVLQRDPGGLPHLVAVVPPRDEASERWSVLDFPEAPEAWIPGRALEDWSGVSLIAVTTPAAAEFVLSEDGDDSLAHVLRGLLGAGVLAILAGLLVLGRRARRGKRPPSGRTGIPALVPLLAALAATGGNGSGAPGRSADSPLVVDCKPLPQLSHEDDAGTRPTGYETAPGALWPGAACVLRNGYA